MAVMYNGSCSHAETAPVTLPPPQFQAPDPAENRAKQGSYSGERNKYCQQMTEPK